MRAAELITLASAHGIDLRQMAPEVTRTRTERAALFASAFPETDGRVQTARGRESHVTRAAMWTVAELGQAAAGVGRIAWLAACYTYAGDRQCFWELHDALTIEAVMMRSRRSWSPQIKDRDGNVRFYLTELAALVLHEDANQPLFRVAPQLYPLYLGVEPDVWNRSVAHRFGAIKLRYLGWLATAEQLIQQRLNEEE